MPDPRQAPLEHRIAAIIREEGGDLLDKILRIGDAVGVPRPPRHVSPIVMGPRA